MNLLDLATELQLLPKRKASTHGGEYSSSCPNPSCGGKDRFLIWPEKGTYWCRQCEMSGDAIQFCRDFFSLSYRDACAKLGTVPKENLNNKINHTRREFCPATASAPTDLWRKRAIDFVHTAHQNALESSEALHLLQGRGFNLDIIKKFKLGWNPFNRFDASNLWGIDSMGGKKTIWLPKGIVIPTFFDSSVMKLKIRRADWNKEDQFAKYIEISGSRKTASLYGGNSKLPYLILESELDAMLVQQVAGDLCNCLAIGGAGKKPDLYCHQILQRSSSIFFALDFDDAGKKAYRFWRLTYPQLKAWPVPRGKSPGDAFLEGVDLRQWLELGIQESSIK